jgi:hypothetical protein
LARFRVVAASVVVVVMATRALPLRLFKPQEFLSTSDDHGREYVGHDEN